MTLKTTKRKNATPEHNLQEAICKYLVLKKWLCIRVNSSAVTTENRFLRSYIIANNKKSSGLADIMACKNGTVIFIEVKYKSNKQSESQIEFNKLCEIHNVNYYVINSLDKLIEIIN